MKRMYPRAVRLALSGKVDPAELVGAVYPLGKAPDAFARAAARDGLKIRINPSA